MIKLVVFTCCAFAAMSSLAIAKPPTIAAVNAVLSQPTPSGRKAEINRQIALACHISLSTSDLNRASAFIEANRTKGAAWVASLISNSDLSNACD